MGKYKYSDRETQLNKVIKLNENLEQALITEREKRREKSDDCISSSEALLHALGYQLPPLCQPAETRKAPKTVTLQSWEDLVSEAESTISYDVELEDILSKEEFRTAYRDLDRIEHEFNSRTRFDKADIAMLTLATALQVIRSILFGALSNSLQNVVRITAEEGDAIVKPQKKAFVEKRSEWSSAKGVQGKKPRQGYGKTWKEIVFGPVPYDATAGSPALGINLEGGYHRYKTFGHDPILGWIFGPLNILTDTITITHPFSSYRVKKMRITPEKLSMLSICSEAIELIQESYYRLPAAVFRQALHLQSDAFTAHGLPIPVLEVFSESFASKLYKEGYDLLRLLQDTHTGISATSSILINMLITVIHGLFFCPTNASDSEKTALERDFYEVRTRKIMIISNSIATSSNVVSAALLRMPGMIDLGGLLVTVTRLFSDIRFITKVKEEYIQSVLDKGLQTELDNLDILWKQCQNQ